MNIKELTMLANGVTPEQLEPDAQLERYIDIFRELLSFDDEFAVVCDSDADGMCSARIWREYFNGTCNIYPLDRMNRNALVTAQSVNESVIVCLDCGSSEAWENIVGKKIYVIDHHETHHKVDGVTYINPVMDYGESTFCTSTLIYSLFEQIYKGNKIAIQYAAIGGIADMVPMLGTNRHVVRRGLKVMNKYPCDIALEFPPYNSPYDESHIGFTIAPAINAPSRIGMSEIAISAIIYGAPDALSSLKGANAKRKALVKKAIDKAKIDEKESCAIVTIDMEGAAITGLIANKIMAQLNKPVMCINGGSVSFRSRTVDIESFIKSVPDELLAGGGHKNAAGGVLDVKQTDMIVDMFVGFCSHQHKKEEIALYDAFIDGDDIYGIKDDWSSLKPYGQKFKALIFGSYLTVNQIGKNGAKEIDSGYAILKLTSANKRYVAISYDIPRKIEVGKDYFFLFEMMEGYILIKGIDNE